MNGPPQDSTNRQRSHVEGLRSYSDQNVMVSGAGATALLGRNILRNGDHGTALDGGMANTNNTGTAYNPYIGPQIPPRNYQGSEITGYAVSRRTHSLGNASEQAYMEAQRAATALLQQQVANAGYEQAARRQANAAAYYPGNMTTFHGHPTAIPAMSNYSRPNFLPPGSQTRQTNDNLWSSGQPGEHNQGNEYNRVRWQPDTDVTNCPICGHVFSFFYRKHHCRKCGRVVCASCSPHRITIPRQFIVNPPSVHPVEIDLTGDTPQENDEAARLAANQLHPNLNGSEEVRVCNPCVPDPNPLPPQIYAAGSNSRLGVNAPWMHQNLPENALLARRSQHMGSAAAAHGYTRFHNPQANSISRHRNIYQPQYNPSANGSTVHYGSFPNTQSAYLPRYAPARSHRHYGSLSALPVSRQRSMLEDLTTTEAPPEEPPQRRILEEDECPICHEELPPKGEDGSESDREAHVASCIESHFSSSKPKDTLMEQATNQVVSGSRPSLAGTSLSSSTVAGPSSRRRTTGMVTYNATEKDCVGEDGSTQECIICFEDFEAGTEMGRLECLCKFHKACIRSWWDTKGAGACPVHQGGLI